MKNVIYLGKVAYYGTRKIHPVEIEVELKQREQGLALSICGSIWNHMRTDCISCGQNIDEIAKLFPDNKKVQRIKEIWERWHLNDMKAGCVHQREWKWEDKRIDPKELPDSNANKDEKGILASWVRSDEHPSGLLGKPCPVCGYKHGTEWLFEQIPSEVIAEIKSW